MQIFLSSTARTDLCIGSFTPTKPARFIMKAYVIPALNPLAVLFIYLYTIHSSFEDGTIFNLLSMLILYFNKDTTGINRMITKQVLLCSTASLPKGTMVLSIMHARLECSKYVGHPPWVAPTAPLFNTQCVIKAETCKASWHWSIIKHNVSHLSLW